MKQILILKFAKFRISLLLTWLNYFGIKKLLLLAQVITCQHHNFSSNFSGLKSDLGISEEKPTFKVEAITLQLYLKMNIEDLPVINSLRRNYLKSEYYSYRILLYLLD
jgi:hypothetical protein